MAWTRIDDKFLNNIKIQKAGALGMALYLAGLIHCNTNLTDGFIDEDILPMLYGLSYQKARNRSVEKLVELKLWHQVDGGYEINDFLDFNRSKSQIEIIKEKRAESGSKGGSNSRAKDKQIAKQIAKQTDEQKSSINTLSPNTLIKQPPPPDARNVFSVYENSISVLNPHMAEVLKSAVEDYSEEWVVESIKEAVENNKRNWRYCESILKRWQVDGFKVDTYKKRNGNGKKPKEPDLGGYEVDRTSEVILVDDGEVWDGDVQF
jgi:DnaD/phage-associated family protein